MWTKYIIIRMVLAHIQRKLFWVSYLTCLEPCPVESISRALWLWVLLATMFTGFESLLFFPLGLPQKPCILHQPAHRSGVASRNWSWCCRDDRWHVVWLSWQICGSFTASTPGRRFYYWICVHMKTPCTQALHEDMLSFLYHMFLHPRKLRIYRTQKMLRAFLNNLYVFLCMYVCMYV